MSDTSGSLTENLIDLIQAAGGARPDSKGLSELYQYLAAALSSFSPGGSSATANINLSISTVTVFDVEILTDYPIDPENQTKGNYISTTSVPTLTYPPGQTILIGPSMGIAIPISTVDYLIGLQIFILNEDLTEIWNLSGALPIPAGFTTGSVTAGDLTLSPITGTDLEWDPFGSGLTTISGGNYCYIVQVQNNFG